MVILFVMHQLHKIPTNSQNPHALNLNPSLRDSTTKHQLHRTPTILKIYPPQTLISQWGKKTTQHRSTLTLNDAFNSIGMHQLHRVPTVLKILMPETLASQWSIELQSITSIEFQFWSLTNPWALSLSAMPWGPYPMPWMMQSIEMHQLHTNPTILRFLMPEL